MRLLDLFCGAGGCSVGYHRAGFAEIVGVDIKPQPNYPFHLVIDDALKFVAEHGSEFDAIHASPPCQAYTGMRRISLSRFGHAPEHPDLIGPVREVLIEIGKPYIIENVQNSPLRTQVILCGASLGLPHIARHRHFESNIAMFGAPQCSHRKNDYTIGVYGERPDGRRVSYRRHRLCRIASSLNEAKTEMGIDWMDWDEIRNSIPPVYTEWIGRQIIQAIESRSS